ncbi:MAG: hypothetical protein WAP35_09040 [Solirubrobacterales bacterium]
MTKSAVMRDRMLHDALRTLTNDAARLLEGRLAEGEEIPFEVGETSRPPAATGTALFAYKPMTAEFVSSHADQLRALDSFDNAANHLSRTRGTVAYLRLRDEPVLDVGDLTHARLGALAFLSAVWSDAEHFEAWVDRFEAAYTELESVVLAERLVTTVFIPVHGVVLDCDIVNLGAGVELLAPEDLDAECIDRFSDSVAGTDCFCAVSIDAPSDAPAPIEAVRRQARNLLTALRMFKPGSVSLGLTAQANVGGAWQQVSLPFTGRSREEAWRLLSGEDEELRQFTAAVRRIERRTRVAWALKRFEMGLERSVPAEGLTDFLAAIRALLEAWDDNGKAALPARVSALCARDDERMHVRGTVEAAFALERLAIDGNIGRSDRKRLAKQPPLEVIAETERYLRALLHDLVCGYLATDLKKLADEILLADGEPTGPETASHEPVYLEPVPDIGSAPPADPGETREFEAVFDDTAEINALDMREDADENEFNEPVALFPSAPVEPAIDGSSDGPDTSSGEIELDDDNVWTLRPAAEIKAAPELREDAEVIDHTPDFIDDTPPGFDDPASVGETVPFAAAPDVEAAFDIAAAADAESAQESAQEFAEEFALEPAHDTAQDSGQDLASIDTPTYAERDTDSRMRELAEQLVDEFDDALSRTMEVEALTEEPRHAPDLFERPPTFDVAPPREQSPPDRPVRATAPVAQGPEAGFTFDFKVVDPPVAADARPDASGPVAAPKATDPIAGSGTDPRFPVREFELPVASGSAVSDSDAAVDAPAQRKNFDEIMDENFTPPPRDLSEKPITPVVSENRPRLVAIDGITRPPSAEQNRHASLAEDAAPPTEPVPSADVPQRPDAPSARTLKSLPQPTIEFDVNELWQSDENVSVEDTTQAAEQPVDPAEARTHRLGPATIEFRPLVDPDKDDPDDFAGAC